VTREEVEIAVRQLFISRVPPSRQVIKNLTAQRAEGMKEEIAAQIQATAEEMSENPTQEDFQRAFNAVILNRVAGFSALMDMTDVLAEMR
jgi:guanylate kinase